MLWPSVLTSIVGILTSNLLIVGEATECIPRNFGHGSVVCVCNSTYCDFTAVNVPDVGRFVIYESGKAGKRLARTTGRFIKNDDFDNEVGRINITVNPNKKYQTIYGFGGAFTDSAGINIKTLSPRAQDVLLETYFGVNGSRYNFGRVPIASTDFSVRDYSYDDHIGDVKLEKFSLASEDYKYKMPLMKKALALNPELRFFSAAWSPPYWMKTTNHSVGFGYLKKEYYQVYADYLLKFLLAYKNHGFNIWAITTGNEPSDGLVPPGAKFQCMGWLPADMANWVATNLGPTIAASETNETLIMMLDDQRFELPWYPAQFFKNPVAKNYTAGIAIHWYTDAYIPVEVVDMTHDEFPDKFILMTEACTGSTLWDLKKVILGDWWRAQEYIASIIQDLNHWIVGWVDWNLALDSAGGPNWVMNNVDASIIVNPANDEFFKQPMYYAIAHFSKFVPRGSTRIRVTDDNDLLTIAFLTPNNETVIVLYNKSFGEKMITIYDPELGSIPMIISELTIQTIIYKR